MQAGIDGLRKPNRMEASANERFAFMAVIIMALLLAVVFAMTRNDEPTVRDSVKDVQRTHPDG